jgi:uncharacterized lipoprotein YehR (DUF1307 family)
MMKNINASLKVLFFAILLVSLNACGNKKPELLSQEWKATGLDFAGTTLSGDQVSLVYNFKQDGMFERTEDGVKEKGKWTLSEDGKKLLLDFEGAEGKVEKEVKELTEAKLVISGQEHTMLRVERLEVNKPVTQ